MQFAQKPLPQNWGRGWGGGFLILLLALFALPLRAHASDPETEIERLIGRITEKSARDTSGVDDDPLLRNWVLGIGAKVSAPSPRQSLPYTFRILNTDIDNAYTLPGAYIFVTRGLLDEVESDDELASVLAHESGHVAKRHALQQIENNVLFLGLLATIPRGKYNALRTTASVYNVLRTLHKSREMEAQADEYGIRFAYASGYDPNGLVHFFEGLGTSEPSRLEQYFDTHPTPKQRIAAARESPLVTRVGEPERARAAQGYAERGLPGAAWMAARGEDPLVLPPSPPTPPLNDFLRAERSRVTRETEAIRKSLQGPYRARVTAKRLSEALVLNSDAGDFRWLYITARAFAVQQDVDSIYARTLRVARFAPGTWDGLVHYTVGARGGESRAIEAGQGRGDTLEALSRVRGAATPIGRAARILEIVFADLHDRFLHPDGIWGWVRYGADEVLLRYAESELARADKMSGIAWRLLSLGRVRRYQLRLNELVPETDTERRALWFDLAQRRFGVAFPTSGATGEATVRGALSAETGESAMHLAAERGDRSWADWVMRSKGGSPENVATAMRLLTLDLEREIQAEERKRAVENQPARGTVGGGPTGTGGIAVERVAPVADGSAQPPR